MQRESQKDRTILCKYEPTEPGDYRIEVTDLFRKGGDNGLLITLVPNKSHTNMGFWLLEIPY